MGVDQYVFIENNQNNIDDDTEICYWRKHNRLQGWMDALWHAKGNVTTQEDKSAWGTSFNGQKLILTLNDINALEKALKERTLPKTQGFFFGSDSYAHIDESGDYSYFDTDMDFIIKAKELIQEGRTIYYRCSW